LRAICFCLVPMLALGGYDTGSPGSDGGGAFSGESRNVGAVVAQASTSSLDRMACNEEPELTAAQDEELGEVVCINAGTA
jgi:hypothetical protein